MSRRFRARHSALAAIGLLVFCLMAVAGGIAFVVGSNVGTSAEIRKEGTEAFLLGQMQSSLSEIDELIADFGRRPDSAALPATGTRFKAASQQFFEAGRMLVSIIDADEAPVVAGMLASFEDHVELIKGLTRESFASTVPSLEAIEIGLRADLLEVQEEENGHLIASIDELRRAERLLIWGIPVLLAAALAVSVLLIRSEFRSLRLTQLEQLNSAKDQFIASVSHELRTPLTSVVALSHELHENYAAFSAGEIQEFAGLIARESGEVSAIVEDLLVAARVDSKQLTIRPETVDIRHEIDRALATCENPHRIVVRGAATAKADAGRVRQILRNLITNAQRHGGAQIRIEAQESGSEVRVVVADDGPGIPRDQRSRVFEPYVTRRGISGSPDSVGLGLFVSRHLAGLMGGSLRYSYEDGWSRMVLTLPAAQVAERPLAAAR